MPSCLSFLLGPKKGEKQRKREGEKATREKERGGPNSKSNPTEKRKEFKGGGLKNPNFFNTRFKNGKDEGRGIKRK